MTVPRLPDRDAGQVDALVADRYLEDLLAAAERRAGDVPSDASLDPDLRHAARVLRASLVRIHPSFRFEERLAGRLADLAAAQAAPAMTADGATATVIPFPGAVAPAGADPLLEAVLAGGLDPSDADAVARASDAVAGDTASRTPLIVVGGAAITSAAISIVGVAWVAWRSAHGDTRTAEALMRRAARTAHARRAARAALAGAGLGGPA